MDKSKIIDTLANQKLSKLDQLQKVDLGSRPDETTLEWQTEREKQPATLLVGEENAKTEETFKLTEIKDGALDYETAGEVFNDKIEENFLSLLQTPEIQKLDKPRTVNLEINRHSALNAQLLVQQAAFESLEEEKRRNKEEENRKIIRDDNDITKFTKMHGAEYLQDIRFSIPLKDIIEVVDSCYYNYFEEYCPILIKLGKDYDKDLIQDQARLAELRRTHRYQLQIWRKVPKPSSADEGIKIFEREIITNDQLAQPITNWNIFSDVFVFQELKNSEVCMVKCFPDKICQFFRFILPKEIKIGSQNAEKNNKPDRLIGYWNQNILFESENKIYSFNVAKEMKNYYPLNWENVSVISVKDLHFTFNPEDYYTLQFTALTKSSTCMVIVNSHTNYATFLKVTDLELQKFQFDKMGIKSEKNINEKKSSGVRIVQFISVMYKSQNNGEVFQAGMSRLSDGTVHFYCEFNLKDLQFEPPQKEGTSQKEWRKIVELGTDLESFYFRCDPFKEDGKEVNQYWSCKIESRHRIGINSSKIHKCQDAQKQFEEFLHRRICHHFQMLKTFTTYDKYFVIAYINRLMFFDLTVQTENLFIGQLEIPDDVITNLFVYEDEDEIAVITERNEIFVVDKSRTLTKTHFWLSNQEIILFQKVCGFQLLLTERKPQIKLALCNSGNPLKKFTSYASKQSKEVLKYAIGDTWCACGVKKRFQKESETYYTCEVAICKCFYCEECYDKKSSLLTCVQGHPVERFQAGTSSVKGDRTDSARYCYHCQCKLNKHDQAEYTCNLGCNFFCCERCFDNQKKIFIIGGKNVFRNHPPKIKKKGESVFRFYVVTRFKACLLLSSDQDEVNDFVLWGFLNQNTQFCIYDWSGGSYSLLIDNPKKNSQMFTVQWLQDRYRLVKNKKELILDKDDTGKLISVKSPSQPYYGKMVGCIVRFTTQSISVYDKDFEFQFAFLNTSIVYTDEINLVSDYIYCMLGASEKKIMLKRKGSEKAEKAVGNFPNKHTAGVFIFDVLRMVKDLNIEFFLICKTIAGINTHIDENKRISFLENFNQVQMLPFVHKSQMTFYGIQPKNEYLVWRQKNGFFTALQKNGQLHTWSMATGKHLFVQSDAELAEKIKGFSVYKSCPTDNSYERFDYNGTNSTVQLLCKKKHNRLKFLPLKDNIQIEEQWQGYYIQDNIKYKMDLKLVVDFDDCIIHGEGSDQQVGEFKIYGEINDKKFNFVKQYVGKHAWFYEGDVINEFHLKGYWGFKNQSIDKFKLFRQQNQEGHDLTFKKTQDSSVVEINYELYYGIFEFKVMQLKMHQDFKEENCCDDEVGQEQVLELFSFEFDLLIKERNRDGIISQEMDDSQRLVLSKDTKKLMLIIDENLFCIYTRGEPSEDNKKIEWEKDPDRQFIKYPNLHPVNIKNNFVFDPTFKYMLVFNYVDLCFEVHETTGKLFKVIPKDLIDCNDNSPETVMLKAKNIFFTTESIIESISPDGLWVMLNIHDEFKVERCAQIKNWQYRQVFDEEYLALSQILRMGQWSEIYLEKEKYYEMIERACDLRRFTKKKNIYQRHLLSSVFRVEINSSLLGIMGSFNGVEKQQMTLDRDFYHFTTVASFTILDLLILEQVLKNSGKVSVQNMDKTMALRFMLNIFPARRTTLHIFVSHGLSEVDTSEADDDFDADSALIALFQVAQKLKFEIPIIQSYRGDTPMDIALAVEGNSQLSYLFGPREDQAIVTPERRCLEKCAPIKLQTSNKKSSVIKIIRLLCGRKEKHENLSISMAAILFACTKDYSFLHSAHSITTAIIKAIQLEVPGIGEYIEGRFKKANHLPNALQKPLKKTVSFKFNEFNKETHQFEIKTYGVLSVKVLNRTQEIQDVMFKKTGSKKIFQMFLLDIPCIHFHNKQGFSFIEALSKTKEVYMFLLPEIRAIIYFHWNSKTVKNFLYFGLILPYVCELILFIYWSNFLLRQESERSGIQTAVEATLLALSAWFLAIEQHQMTKKGVKYFQNYWNAIQILPLVLIPVNISRHLVNGDAIFFDATFWNVQAVAALALWLNSLYLLRAFDETGWIIRSLAEVVKDMRVFLFVLGIMVCGFADAFGSVNKAQPLGEIQYGKFIEGEDYGFSLWFSYNLMMGNWNLGESSLLAIFLFVAATILEVVVMLNLLIAIVSGTFQKVTDNSVQYSYKEKVSLINDIYDSFEIFSCLKIKVYQDTNELMLLVKELEKKRDTIAYDHDLDAHHMSIQSQTLEEMKILFEKHNSELKTLKEEITSLKEFIK